MQSNNLFHKGLVCEAKLCILIHKVNTLLLLNLICSLSLTVDWNCLCEREENVSNTLTNNKGRRFYLLIRQSGFGHLTLSHSNDKVNFKTNCWHSKLVAPDRFGPNSTIFVNDTVEASKYKFLFWLMLTL